MIAELVLLPENIACCWTVHLSHIEVRELDAPIAVGCLNVEGG